MTSVLLALVLILPTQTQMDAYQTWDRLSWEYQLPPASITVNAPWMRERALGSFAGFDAQGRAVIGIRGASDEALKNNVAHEAAHALLAPLGMTIDQEHEWADSFAFCANGIDTSNFGTTVKSCGEVRLFFARFHR